MSGVRVDILEGPLPPQPAPTVAYAGAVLVFEGVVRPLEDGKPLRALDYEVYEPMAQKILARLGQAAIDEHGLTALSVEHSLGRVEVGQRSFRLTIASPHRKEALAAMDAFIDAMKRDAPIWKRAVFAETDRTHPQEPRA
jgi:molybdopterin synthase catalytic subunit